MLTWLILLPVIGAAIVALVPSRRRELHLPLGITLSVLPLALAGYIFWIFEPASGQQLVDFAVWYEPWGISWYLGVDGISLPMIILTTLCLIGAITYAGNHLFGRYLGLAVEDKIALEKEQTPAQAALDSVAQKDVDTDAMKAAIQRAQGNRE